jgi:adenylate cyclase
VVWPFEAPAGDEDQEIAARLREELVLELCRYRDVRVVFRRDEVAPDAEAHPSARFEVRGRVRGQGGARQVVAGLVDRATGEQVWGDEYPLESVAEPAALDDIGRVIAARVGAEQGVIVQSLAAQHHRRSSRPGGAYGAVLRSHLFFFARDLAEYPRAVAALQHTVAEQPEIALAWSHLARLYMANYSFELTKLATPIDDAIAHAYQAVRLDPTNARARCLLASSLLIKGETGAARNELEQAARFNPTSLVYLEVLGYLRVLCGEWEEGAGLIRQAMRRNPHHLPHAHVGLWAYHMRRGEFAEASAVALEHRDPMFFWRSLMRASALGQMGRTEEAEARSAELRREKPGFADRGRVLIGHYLKDAALQETVIEGLRRGGLEVR